MESNHSIIFSDKGDLFFGSEINSYSFARLNASMNPQRVYDQLIYSIADH